jgi:signal transduction histidine kinase
LLIWLAYLAIPVVLLFFVFRRRVPFPMIFWLFGAFIITCGFTHLMEVVTFWQPVYRLSALVKMLTAFASWATVLALVPVIPRALALRSTEELAYLVEERTSELATVNEALRLQIAQRRQMQEEREKLLVSEQHARAEAEEANRAKDEFLATLSHELRTPLNAMLGWIHLLRSGKLDPQTRDHALEVINRNIRTQAHLIGDLLDVSGIVLGKLRLDVKPLPLRGVVEAALESVRLSAEARGVQLAVQLDAEDVIVRGDAVRLQQVVWNLLSNAVKFSPSGSRVEVALTHGDGQAHLSVHDSGPGIAAEFLPHVFERFSQADPTTTRSHGGLGLGLSIVRDLVELHGGSVRVDCASNSDGACFRVDLPLAEAGVEEDNRDRQEGCLS